jgi:hypothetical protein
VRIGGDQTAVNHAQIELAQRGLLRHLVGVIDRAHFDRYLDAVPNYSGGAPTADDVSDLIAATASPKWLKDMRERIGEL